MPALLQKTLKVVPAPLIEGVPAAPPVPNPTVECKCGNCGAVLMRVEEGKAYPLLGPLRLLRLIQFDGRLTIQRASMFLSPRTCEI